MKQRMTKADKLINSTAEYYGVFQHPPCYTANGLARALDLDSSDVLKTVALIAGDRFFLAVIPACFQIDFIRVESVTGLRGVRLASEKEIVEKFPDCQLGAVPPLGSPYGVTVLVDDECLKCNNVTFATGSLTEAVQIPVGLFRHINSPTAAVCVLH